MFKNSRILTVGLIALALAVPAPPANASAISQGRVPAWLTISSQGGFVAPDYIKTQLPQLVAYSDGVVLQNDVMSVRSDILGMSRRVLSTSWLKKQVLAIAKLTKTPKGGWGTPAVADVPDTRIQINLGSTRVSIGVFALGFTNGQLTTTQIAARKALSKAITSLTAAVNKKSATILKPTKYEVWVNNDIAPSGGLGIANPASVFCASMGGVTEIQSSPNGDVGYCVFGDLKLDEWEYYRTESVKLSGWPASVPVLKTGCNVVAASLLTGAFTYPNETGRWVTAGGQAFNPVFRPVLAGETACKR